MSGRPGPRASSARFSLRRTARVVGHRCVIRMAATISALSKKICADDGWWPGGRGQAEGRGPAW